MSSLTIQILGWNSAASLRATLPRLQHPPAYVAGLRYIDNGSTDDSVAVVRALLPHAEIIALSTNRGFSGGHNIGIARTTTPFLLIINPDVEVVWPGIEQLLAAMREPKLAAVQGKLLRHRGRPAMLDSTGIVLTPALSGRDQGAGEIDTGQYNTRGERLATTGACSLYRIAALQQVRHGAEEFFDADFFAYKEDVDLGWRLNRQGWHTRYEPVLAGYHARALRQAGATGWGGSFRDIIRRLRDPRTDLSLRNWVWLVAKNASMFQLLTHSPFLAARVITFGMLSLIYWPLLGAWAAAARGLPAMLGKRRAVA